MAKYLIIILLLISAITAFACEISPEIYAKQSWGKSQSINISASEVGVGVSCGLIGGALRITSGISTDNSQVYIKRYNKTIGTSQNLIYVSSQVGYPIYRGGGFRISPYIAASASKSVGVGETSSQAGFGISISYKPFEFAIMAGRQFKTDLLPQLDGFGISIKGRF